MRTSSPLPAVCCAIADAPFRRAMLFAASFSSSPADAATMIYALCRRNDPLADIHTAACTLNILSESACVARRRPTRPGECAAEEDLAAYKTRQQRCPYRRRIIPIAPRFLLDVATTERLSTLMTPFFAADSASAVRGMRRRTQSGGLRPLYARRRACESPDSDARYAVRA